MKADKLHEYWHGVEIGRDNCGFVEAEPSMLYEIMKRDLPLLIHDTRDNTFEAINDEGELLEWVDDIYNHVCYDMYLYQYTTEKGGEE